MLGLLIVMVAIFLVIFNGLLELVVRLGAFLLCLGWNACRRRLMRR